MITLRPYQEELKNNAATMLASGVRKLLVQLPTGGGKTICFSAITSGWVQKNNSSVLILVHRRELLNQTRLALYNHFGISAQPIVAGMRHLPPAEVYVGMIESTFRKIDNISNIGLVIIDEAHLANFFKIHKHFEEQYILGFTATPYSANQKKPLKDYYQDIVTTVQVKDLIQIGSLAQNITYAPRDIVERASLTLKGGDFDEGFMAKAYSAPKYVNNTVACYERYAKGTKAIVFNCNIDHSKEVDRAFRLAGYESYHIDGTMGDTERRNILTRFANTPKAILNNVAIATTGTDIPSIETVIMNRATKSKITWLQCTGRGSRPTKTKSAYKIIDLGGNALELGDWSDDRDWYHIFHNTPKSKSKDQVAPCKSCPQCDAILPASVRTCQFCGYQFPEKTEAEEGEMSELVIVTKNIDVSKLLRRNSHRKEYFTFFEIGRKIAVRAKKKFPVLSEQIIEQLLDEYEIHVRNWCKEVGKRFTGWHKATLKEHLLKELSEGSEEKVKKENMSEMQIKPVQNIREMHKMQMIYIS